LVCSTGLFLPFFDGAACINYLFFFLGWPNQVVCGAGLNLGYCKCLLLLVSSFKLRFSFSFVDDGGHYECGFAIFSKALLLGWLGKRLKNMEK